jgi:ubiquitin carboxyl-terminal hydrolase 7
MVLQGTKVEGTIARLFEGHMHMFIECINVDYKSTRRESFMDLQLDVKGCKNIYDSFDKYCEVEVMDGQNQYKTDDHGLQVLISPWAQPACGLIARHWQASCGLCLQANQ